MIVIFCMRLWDVLLVPCRECSCAKMGNAVGIWLGHVRKHRGVHLETGPVVLHKQVSTSFISAGDTFILHRPCVKKVRWGRNLSKFIRPNTFPNIKAHLVLSHFWDFPAFTWAASKSKTYIFSDESTLTVIDCVEGFRFRSFDRVKESVYLSTVI